MGANYRYSTSQLFNFAEDSYLERTSRPIYAVVFLLPFIVFYELGTILINTSVLNQSSVRVVAFLWLQNSLKYLGLASKLAWAAPPLVVVFILIVLQLVSRKRWHFGLGDIWPMAVECILFAIPLVVLSLFLSSSPQQAGDIAMRIQVESPVIEGQSLLANIVTAIGAGIYEELVFRLILICGLMLLFSGVLRLGHKNSIIFSILASAALFSAHHHIVYLNGQLALSAPFNWPEFGFRTIAGVYFAALFAIRGFGITAGTHAFYDIIATVVSAIFF